MKSKKSVSDYTHLSRHQKEESEHQKVKILQKQLQKQISNDQTAKKAAQIIQSWLNK